MLVPASDSTDRGALARVERLERRVGVQSTVGATDGNAAATARLPAPRAADPVTSRRTPDAGQDQLRATQDADTQLAAQRVHDDLSGLAAASRVLSPQDPRLTGHLGTMVLNAAYLVDSTQGQAFAERVQERVVAGHGEISRPRRPGGW